MPRPHVTARIPKPAPVHTRNILDDLATGLHDRAREMAPNGDLTKIRVVHPGRFEVVNPRVIPEPDRG